MKWLFRWLFRLLILCVVLIVAGILLLDSIVKAIAESQLRKRTGMEVKIGSMSVGLMSPVITVEDFKLYNTAEFGGSPFVNVPELHLEYDRNKLFRRILHCRLIRVNVAEVNIVLNKAGKTNVEALEEWQRKPPVPGVPGAVAGGNGTNESRFVFPIIDTLNLTVGKATTLTMSNPGQVNEWKLNIRNKIVSNVTSEHDLEMKLALIVWEGGGGGLFEYVNKNSNQQPDPAPQPKR